MRKSYTKGRYTLYQLKTLDLAVIYKGRDGLKRIIKVLKCNRLLTKNELKKLLINSLVNDII